MTQASFEISDVHWLMDILQNIDVGLVVLDKDFKIQMWNNFMESHSSISPQKAMHTRLFDLFPDISERWFKQKSKPVFELKTRAFTTWEQRPYLFRFPNTRPITGRCEFMYQNCSIIPLESVDKKVDHLCIIVYDVTNAATNKIYTDLKESTHNHKDTLQMYPREP